MHALKERWTGTVQLFLDRGAALNFPEHPYIQTPLMVACQYSDASTILLLLYKGACIDSVDSQGCSAFAYTSGRPEIASLLWDWIVTRPAAESALPTLDEQVRVYRISVHGTKLTGHAHPDAGPRNYSTKHTFPLEPLDSFILCIQAPCNITYPNEIARRVLTL